MDDHGEEPPRTMSETTPVSIKVLQKLSDCFGPDWQALGRELNIPEAEIQRTSTEYTSSKEGLLQLLLKWRRRNYKTATKDVLQQALIRVERSDLAHEIFQDESTSEENGEWLRNYQSPERTVATDHTDCEHNNHRTPFLPIDLSNKNEFKGARKLSYSERSQRHGRSTRKSSQNMKKEVRKSERKNRRTRSTSTSSTQTGIKREKRSSKRKTRRQKYHREEESSSTEDEENWAPKIDNVNININIQGPVHVSL